MYFLSLSSSSPVSPVPLVKYVEVYKQKPKRRKLFDVKKNLYYVNIFSLYVFIIRLYTEGFLLQIIFILHSEQKCPCKPIICFYGSCAHFLEIQVFE